MATRAGSMRRIARICADWLLKAEDGPGDQVPTDACGSEAQTLRQAADRLTDAGVRFRRLDASRRLALSTAERARNSERYWRRMQLKTGAEVVGEGPSFPASTPDFPFGVPKPAQQDARQAYSQARVNRAAEQADTSAFKGMGGAPAWRLAKAEVEAAEAHRQQAEAAYERCRSSLERAQRLN